MIEIEEYNDAISFTYYSDSGRYILYDNLVGNTLGEAVLVDGPGWVFVMKEYRFLMQDELAAVLSFIEDLNAELEAGESCVANAKSLSVK